MRSVSYYLTNPEEVKPIFSSLILQNGKYFKLKFGKDKTSSEESHSKNKE